MRVHYVLALLITAVSLCAFSIGPLNHQGSYSMFAIEDSLEKDRLKFMNEVLASIKGKEKWPADSVFKNLKVIKGQSLFPPNIFCG
jgi:hypothetical protein